MQDSDESPLLPDMETADLQTKGRQREFALALAWGPRTPFPDGLLRLSSSFGSSSDLASASLAAQEGRAQFVHPLLGSLKVPNAGAWHCMLPHSARLMSAGAVPRMLHRCAERQLSLPPSVRVLSGQDQRRREGGAAGHERSRAFPLLCRCKLELQAQQQAESGTSSVSMGWDALDLEGFQQ